MNLARRRLNGRLLNRDGWWWHDHFRRHHGGVKALRRKAARLQTKHPDVPDHFINWMLTKLGHPRPPYPTEKATSTCQNSP